MVLMSFFFSIKRVVDYFLPKSLRELSKANQSHKNLRKTRLIIISSLGLSLFLLSTAVFRHSIESGPFHFKTLFSFVVSSLCLANLATIKNWGQNKMPGLSIAALSWITITVQSYFTKGLEGPTAFWLAIIPVFTAIILNLRWSLFWTFMSLVSLLGLLLGHQAEPTITNNTFLFNNFITLTALCLTLFIFSFIYESERKQYKLYILDTEKKKSIEERIKSMGRVAAGMAHEINSPLTVISGRTSRMSKNLKGIDPFCQSDNISSLKRELEKINITVARISQLTQGLISYTQGQGEYNIDAFTLKELSGKLKKSIPPLLGTYQFKLILPKEQPLQEGIIQGHIHLIEKVVLSMIENSIQANHEHPHPWVHLEFKTNIKNKNTFIQIYITDSGEGIEPSIAERIFDPFFTTKSLGKNRGLSLGLSRTIIKQHGGALSYNSINTNTQFILELPLVNLF